MKAYIRNCYHFLNSNPPHCAFINSESLLECLWLCHTSARSIDEGEILGKFESLGACWGSLSKKRQRILIRAVVELSLELEHAGFLSGVHAGAQIMSELTQKDHAE